MKQAYSFHSLAQTYLLPIGVSIASSMLMLCLASLLFVIADIQFNALPTVSLFALVLGAFLGGFQAAKNAGERGLVTGLIVGAAVFLFYLLIGLFVEPVSATLFSKGTAILFGAALGGVLGVNKRQRIRRGIKSF